MANFINNEVKQVFKDTINKLRQDIGRNVTVVGDPTTIDCPNCGWDEVKKRSNGRYQPSSPYPAGVAGPTDFTGVSLHCPVCNGSGKVVTQSGSTQVLCMISALGQDDAEATPLGKDFRRNYELSATIDSKTAFEKAKSIIVDGHACKVVAVIPDGIGDLTQVTIYAGG